MRRRFGPQRVERGFTLVELMAVVAITGILAVIGISLMMTHMRSAQMTKGLADIQALRSAEEAFKAQNGRYLDCSRATGPVWYPGPAVGKTAYSWQQPNHADWQWWRQLAPNRGDQTTFGFLVNAGLPQEKFTNLQLKTYTWDTNAAVTEPWYVIQMMGDNDKDGVPVLALATSSSNTVSVENEDQ